MDDRSMMQEYYPALLSTGILGPQGAEVLMRPGLITPVNDRPTNQSPLETLNEVIARAGVECAPTFEFEEIGQNRERMFRCTASFPCGSETWQGSAMGFTKKDAKQKAASEVLHLLDGQNLLTKMSYRKRTVSGKDLRPEKDPVQSPVSFLNDMCSRSQLVPTFTFVESGPVHMRTFECNLTVKSPRDLQAQPILGNGQGKTKKNAKQDAAINLLKALRPDIVSEKFDAWFKKEKDETVCKPNNRGFEQIDGNPLGELNELCMKTKKVIPEYEEQEPQGSQHEPVFTVICKIGSNLIEEGKGSSTKNAKRLAAHKMLERIKSLPEDKDLDESLEASLKGLSLAITNSGCHFTPAEIIKNFNRRTGNVLDVIRSPDRNRPISDPLGVLHDVADEQKLQLEWLDAQDPANAEKYQMLFLGSNPAVIFCGRGENRNKCRKNAADNAIMFLRSTVVSN